MGIDRVQNGAVRFSEKDFEIPSRIVIQYSGNRSGDGAKFAIKEDSFDPELLRRVVDQIKSTFNMFDTRLHFRVNIEANTVVVEVVDLRTNAVLKQIPSEEIQELKMKLKELSGALVDVKA